LTNNILDVDETTTYWKELMESGEEPEDGDSMILSPGVNIPALDREAMIES